MLKRLVYNGIRQKNGVAVLLPEMNISPITEKDLPELADLYQQLIPNEVSLTSMRAVLTRQRNNPNQIILAARDDQLIISS